MTHWRHAHPLSVRHINPETYLLHSFGSGLGNQGYERRLKVAVGHYHYGGGIPDWSLRRRETEEEKCPHRPPQRMAIIIIVWIMVLRLRPTTNQVHHHSPRTATTATTTTTTTFHSHVDIGVIFPIMWYQHMYHFIGISNYFTAMSLWLSYRPWYWVSSVTAPNTSFWYPSLTGPTIPTLPKMRPRRLPPSFIRYNWSRACLFVFEYYHDCPWQQQQPTTTTTTTIHRNTWR